jgi:hypothetical protein
MKTLHKNDEIVRVFKLSRKKISGTLTLTPKRSFAKNLLDIAQTKAQSKTVFEPYLPMRKKINHSTKTFFSTTALTFFNSKNFSKHVIGRSFSSAWLQVTNSR